MTAKPPKARRRPKIAPSAPRMRKLRERLAADGGRSITVTLSPDAYSALERLRVGTTTAKAVEDALIMADEEAFS